MLLFEGCDEIKDSMSHFFLKGFNRKGKIIAWSIKGTTKIC